MEKEKFNSTEDYSYNNNIAVAGVDTVQAESATSLGGENANQDIAGVCERIESLVRNFSSQLYLGRV